MQSPKVLVVDDDGDVRDFFSQVLAGEGCRVTVAENGEIALSLIKKDAFDLVITDIKMPVKDGLQLLQEIRETGSTVDVIAATGYGQVETYLRAISLGAVEFIHKPVHTKELRKIVRQVLNKKTRDISAGTP